MKQCLALFLFFFTSAFADETINEITAGESKSYNYWGEFANMLLTLGFVIILIFLTVWLLKKLMRSRMHSLNRSNGIKILEKRPLNPKAALYLIDVLGKGVVISESAAGIQLITEFTDTTKMQEMLMQQQLGKSSASLAAFSEKIKKPNGESMKCVNNVTDSP